MLECFEKLNLQWLNRAYVYTGSVGPAMRDFRYRWELDGEDKLLHAAVYSKVCYEKADDVERHNFTWDGAGVEAMKNWLQNRYECFAAQQTSQGKATP